MVQSLWSCLSNSKFPTIFSPAVCHREFFAVGGELFMHLEREGVFLEDTARFVKLYLSGVVYDAMVFGRVHVKGL